MTLAGTFLSNVSPGTADILSYSMLGVVALFLASVTLITYFYYKKHKRETAASPMAAA